MKRSINIVTEIDTEFDMDIPVPSTEDCESAEMYADKLMTIAEEKLKKILQYRPFEVVNHYITADIDGKLIKIVGPNRHACEVDPDFEDKWDDYKELFNK